MGGDYLAEMRVIRNVATVTSVVSELRTIDHRPVAVVPWAMRVALCGT